MAAFCFSFAGAAVIAVALLTYDLSIYAAIVSLVLLSVSAVLRKPRGKKTLVRIFAGLSVGFIWCWVYGIVFYEPAASLDGGTFEVTARVTDFPTYSTYGMGVETRISTGEKVTIYGDEDELLGLSPGDELSFTTTFSLPDDPTYYNANGQYILARKTKNIELVSGSGSVLPYLHKYAARFVKETVSKIFPDDAAGLVKALLLGDRTEFNEDAETVNIMTRSGVLHILAVSGMHIAILANIMTALFGKKRSGIIVTLAMLLMFAVLCGFSASVTRAVIMQAVLLLSTLTRRSTDKVTSLSIAAALILAVNPYSVMDIGFQLSFSATLGIILLTPKINGYFAKPLRKIRAGKPRSALRSVVSGISVTVGASIFSLPISAMYFEVVSLVSPLTNLIVSVFVSPIYVLCIAATILGMVFAPLGTVAAFVPTLLIRLLITILKPISKWFFAAIYLDSAAYAVWFAVVYFAAVVLICVWRPRGFKLIWYLCPAALSLCVIVIINAFIASGGEGYTATVLDVGQGQCIVISCGNRTAIVDCGSISGEDAGDTARRFISQSGSDSIEYLILTHYHSDHTNGIDELMAAIDVDTLILPPITEEDTERGEKILSYAEKYGSQVVYADNDIAMELDTSSITVFAPMGSETENERGICILVTDGSYDTLITGDITSNLEMELVTNRDIPDLECLVVGHHGSKYSTCDEFLDAVTPEIAIISVGDNNYGHPTDEVLRRLEDDDIVIYRTDTDGNVTVKSR